MISLPFLVKKYNSKSEKLVVYWLLNSSINVMSVSIVTTINEAKLL